MEPGLIPIGLDRNISLLSCLYCFEAEARDCQSTCMANHNLLIRIVVCAYLYVQINSHKTLLGCRRFFKILESAEFRDEQRHTAASGG